MTSDVSHPDQRGVATKLKLAIYWGASCGGCDIALLEMHERVFELLEIADIVFWPCVMDVKYADVGAMANDSIDLCLYNGAIRSEENAHMARVLRQKSRVMVAFGACAHLGGIPALANSLHHSALIERASTTESTTGSARPLPGPAATAYPWSHGLPALTPRAKPLSEVVAVDYTVPGCAPESPQVWAMLQHVAAATLPPAPAIIGAGSRVVCEECELQQSGQRVTRFRRYHDVIPEPGRCLLEQGIVCNGPATRSGCGGRCTAALIPCRGCYGPPAEERDAVSAMIGALGSVTEADSVDAIERALADVVDPLATLGRYSLGKGLVSRFAGAMVHDEDSGS